MSRFEMTPDEPPMSLDEMLDSMIEQSVSPDQMNTPQGQEKVADILLMVFFNSMMRPPPGIPEVEINRQKDQMMARLRKIPAAVILNIREKKRATYLQQDKLLADLAVS